MGAARSFKKSAEVVGWRRFVCGRSLMASWGFVTVAFAQLAAVPYSSAIDDKERRFKTAVGAYELPLPLDCLFSTGFWDHLQLEAV